MNERIEQLLVELYEADPGLKKHEDAVYSVITELINTRPESTLDEQFKHELRRKILEHASVLKPAKKLRTITNYMNTTLQRVLFATGGAVIAVLLIVPFVNRNNSTIPSLLSRNDSNSLMSFAPTITSVKRGAFGELAQTSAQSETRGAGAGFGGGGAGMSVSAPSQITGTASTDAKMIDPAMMPPMDFVTHKFVYKGGEITLEGEGVEILKRIKGQRASATLGAILSNLNISEFNLGNFGDAVVQSMSFIQNKPFGYSLYINPFDGSVSLSENWEQWYGVCTSNGCPEQSRLNLSDVPTDEELIALANAFMAEHEIDMTSYGAPQVQQEWRVWYDLAIRPEDKYIPDSLTVVYPLQIDGKNVYDESGMLAGPKVNVNIRFKKVGGMYDLTTQTYEKSSYEAETDVSKILQIAERGGIYGYIAEDGRVIEVPLQSPTYGYLKMWRGQDELLVPALVFEIDGQAEQLYRKNVVIPLAKELLNIPDFGPITTFKEEAR